MPQRPRRGRFELSLALSVGIAYRLKLSSWLWPATDTPKAFDNLAQGKRETRHPGITNQ